MAVTPHLLALFEAMHAVIRAIPRGTVATYGQVAELAGLPGGARVAAASLKSVNMRGKRVPWQRVIGKAGPMRGRIKILDPVGAAMQRKLLLAEGVPIGDAGTVDLRRYGWLPSAEPPPRRAARKRAAPKRASGGRDARLSSRRRP